ncbi:Hypothetical predicted protein [Pelobates cultripes]|uniref:Uncharacterized protein n=1 Tax=Pelobates cultripes TaxID=61616 RepID=A0AAD1RIM7_PELCU|nr:Hypothetical predicted protein [Pelobates cultripes]
MLTLKAGSTGKPICRRPGITGSEKEEVGRERPGRTIERKPRALDSPEQGLFLVFCLPFRSLSKFYFRQV